MYVLQNMIVASAGIFNLEKSDKNVFFQHHLHPFLFNFAHGFCLVLVLSHPCARDIANIRLGETRCHAFS